MSEPTVRPAARLIVVRPDCRVLLMLWGHAPGVPGGRVWFTPGGGLDSGETHEEAAARELREETGFVARIGPCVWERRHVFSYRGQLIDQRERFFVVRVPDGAPDFGGWTADEREDIGDVRWWSAEEIAGSAETFAPRRLAELLPPILREDYSPRPISIGI